MKTQKTISIETALQQGNSIKNQDIKSKFIGQHVHANVNSMVEYIISKSYEDQNAPFTFDDIDNFYSYPEYIGTYANFAGGTEEQKNTEEYRLKELISLNEDLINDDEQETDTEGLEAQNEAIQSEIEALENLENEVQEVFEWWLVSDFLCRKLNELGHPVIEDHNIWGRCTTGQAILLDYAITQICAEMEILEGQANSWA
jgi:hypothetical protein